MPFCENTEKIKPCCQDNAVFSFDLEKVKPLLLLVGAVLSIKQTKGVVP